MKMFRLDGVELFDGTIRYSDGGTGKPIEG